MATRGRIAHDTRKDMPIAWIGRQLALRTTPLGAGRIRGLGTDQERVPPA